MFLAGVAQGIHYAETIVDEGEDAKRRVARIDGRSFRSFAVSCLAPRVYALLEKIHETGFSNSEEFWALWTNDNDTGGCARPDDLYVRGFVFGLAKAIREDFWPDPFGPSRAGR